jgi:predicted enzyme related to lactoylglutathione lyase
MPRRKSSPRSRKVPDMLKEVDDIDETLAKRGAGGSPVYPGKMKSLVCRLAVARDPGGSSFTIHQRKSSS